jgi:ribose 5-phosphate isomerase B
MEQSAVRIVIGADHAGFELKQRLVQELQEWGHAVVDVGTYDAEPADYPDPAEMVGRTLLENGAERGILVCGSDVGASIAANKLPGIRAGLCHDEYAARQGVEDDNMNVLVLGARIIGTGAARAYVRAFLGAVFSGQQRHARRLEKLRALERRYAGERRRAKREKPGS